MLHESPYFKIFGKNPPPESCYIGFWCPGCKTLHGINNTWQITFVGNKPTVAPSVLTHKPNEPAGERCHLFIRNGRIEFLSDCTHALAGKTVDMERMEDHATLYS